MTRKRTQVGIVGAGPAGLLLAHLLHLEGIDSVVTEERNRAYVEARIRAGVIEHEAAQLLVESGLGERMLRQGLRHTGIELRFEGDNHRIDLSGLTGGKYVTVYGQHEVVIDLIAARLATGRDLVFEVGDVQIAGFGGGQPVISYVHEGARAEIECDFIAGCDGFHGVCRASIPSPEIKSYDRVYPFAWLGVLAETPPASPELIYVHHDRGFALLSMRSPTISRVYLQCPPDEDAERWTDTAFWDEVDRRLEGRNVPKLVRGPILQKSVTGMRRFVADPMRHGRLFLAGDAAHIVPPTGAKGMNLAIGDVRLLSRAFAAHYKSGRDDLLETYSATAMRRIWQAQRFSWWMTSLLHKFDNETPFNHYRQLAEMNYAVSSRAAATALAENYVGLPFDF